MNLKKKSGVSNYALYLLIDILSRSWFSVELMCLFSIFRLNEGFCTPRWKKDPLNFGIKQVYKGGTPTVTR